MSDLTLVVVGADWQSLRQQMNSSLTKDRAFGLDTLEDQELVLLPNQPPVSLASIGNWYLEHARSPVLGLVHPDTVYGRGALREFTQVALGGTVCGIVGISPDGEYVWSYRTNCLRSVETLDSCSVFFRRDLGLRFDEQTFDGFHGHVQDLCMQAHAREIPVLVPPADASHAGVNYLQPAWRADWERYRVRLCDKWGRLVRTT